MNIYDAPDKKTGKLLALSVSRTVHTLSNDGGY
jgi:hypothetical protein